MAQTHSQKAAELFLSGYNCSQAVFAAFAEDCGINEKTALKLASSFGGGMGRLREVCGAVTAMFAVAGILCGYDTPDNKSKKDEHYKLIQSLTDEFKACHSAYICRDLLGTAGKSSHISEHRTERYYKTRPCIKFVITAADILDKHFFCGGDIK